MTKLSSSDYNLKDILNIAQWEAVQDQLAEYTGTAIITIDYKGMPITKHSLRTEFCSVIRENPISCKRCYKCDSLAGLEAVRLNRPFIYLCHCGIVDVAVPVTIDNRYLGAIMFGEVRLPDGETENKIERLVSEISSFEPDSNQVHNDLMELYRRIPEMKYERIEKTAQLIAAIVDYIVQKYLDRSNQYKTIDWLLKSMEPASSEILDLRSIAHIEELVTSESRTATADSITLDVSVKKSSPIYPALIYIENHIDETIKMQDMATLCNFSSSYFSRIFIRDVGENFKDYLNRKKVQAAKKLLRESDEGVNQISYSLGFMDPSYFIKIFKKVEGTTPMQYRNYKYR